MMFTGSGHLEGQAHLLLTEVFVGSQEPRKRSPELPGKTDLRHPHLDGTEDPNAPKEEGEEKEEAN